jgi:hypothetical protein
MGEVVIIRNQANIGASISAQEMARMAKRRFQNPQPKRRGAWWTIRVWRDEFIAGKHVRKQQRVRLAAATVPEREIQKIVSEYLRPLNPGSGKSWVGDQLRALHRNDLQTSREASDGDNQF